MCCMRSLLLVAALTLFAAPAHAICSDDTNRNAAFDFFEQYLTQIGIYERSLLGPVYGSSCAQSVTREATYHKHAQPNYFDAYFGTACYNANNTRWYEATINFKPVTNWMFYGRVGCFCFPGSSQAPACGWL